MSKQNMCFSLQFYNFVAVCFCLLNFKMAVRVLFVGFERFNVKLPC